MIDTLDSRSCQRHVCSFPMTYTQARSSHTPLAFGGAQPTVNDKTGLPKPAQDHDR